MISMTDQEVLLIYGIPNFKLEKNIVERRTKLLKESGIKFELNFVVGKNATLSEFKKKTRCNTHCNRRIQG